MIYCFDWIRFILDF